MMLPIQNRLNYWLIDDLDTIFSDIKTPLRFRSGYVLERIMMLPYIEYRAGCVKKRIGKRLSIAHSL